MSFTIAISGKGGVGKTTLAGLIVSRMITLNYKPILAVDADPNACLDEVLGVKLEKTIGGVREEAREIVGKGLSSGISKQELLELKIEESIVETEDFDLIAMGRPEGPGCYCYANNVLKNALGKLSDQYPFVVLDNEAGLENLSRRIVQKVNLLIMVTDPSKRGLDTVRRLHQLAAEMGIHYEKLAIVINRLRSESLPDHVSELKQETAADWLFGLPDDLELADIAEQGKPIRELDENNPVSIRIDQFIKDLEI